jgi:hypothetical protein
MIELSLLVSGLMSSSALKMFITKDETSAFEVFAQRFENMICDSRRKQKIILNY